MGQTLAIDNETNFFYLLTFVTEFVQEDFNISLVP